MWFKSWIFGAIISVGLSGHELAKFHKVINVFAKDAQKMSKLLRLLTKFSEI